MIRLIRVGTAFVSPNSIGRLVTDGRIGRANKFSIQSPLEAAGTDFRC
jgi:hypothetical protein